MLAHSPRKARTNGTPGRGAAGPSKVMTAAALLLLDSIPGGLDSQLEGFELELAFWAGCFPESLKEVSCLLLNPCFLDLP